MKIGNKEWRESMKLRYDFNNMMDSYIEGEGISDKQLSSLKPLAKKAFEAVKAGRGQGMMGWYELPYNQNEVVDDIIKTAKNIRKNRTLC